MIAHVAEVGENSGRVVLQLGPQPSPVALEAAFHLARGFRSEIEGLYTDDDSLTDLAAFPFAREISVSGVVKGPFDPQTLDRRRRRTAAAVLRHVAAAAAQAGVHLTAAIKPGDPARSLAAACAERGPWNVVALAEPIDGDHGMARLREIFETVWGTTGIVVTGPSTRRTAGPVVAVVESAERFASLLRTAETLAMATASATAVILAGHSPEHVIEMETQARLLANDETHGRIPITAITHGGATAIGEALREVHAGFVVAQYDGLAFPADGVDSLLREGLEGPLFLVR